jgi:hypothetical protein
MNTINTGNIIINIVFLPIIIIINIISAPSRYAENFLPRRTKTMMADLGKNGKDIFKNKDWGGSHW